MGQTVYTPNVSPAAVTKLGNCCGGGGGVGAYDGDGGYG
jgi:hypothetical protein